MATNRPLNSKITVLHLVHTMAYGGVETALINWVRKINRERFNVHVACFANPGATEEPFVRAAERAGISVEKIPWGRHKPIFRAARALRRLIRRYDVDILHTHNWYADYVGGVVRWLAPVKTMTTCYVWSNFDWKRNLLQSIDKYVIRRFDLVTVHCEDTYRKTLALGIPAHKVRLLICGFECNWVEWSAEERLRRRRALGIADDQILLINVARFYPEKAHDFLLRSFRRIVSRYPHARLFILGVGPLEADLKRLCSELGLDSTVRFPGFVEDLPALMQLADIQVHPSWMEGVALAILTGMAVGLPIAASDVGGLREVLKNEENSLLTAAGDEKGFVESVARLIESEAERRRLGAAARRFVENDYSLAAAVRRVEEAYVEVMQGCGMVCSS